MQNIVKKILKEKGATLNHKGEAVEFKTGYQVSIKDLLIKDAKTLDTDAIKNVLEMAKEQKAYAGFWIDRDKAYIDLSKRYATKKEALKLGKEKSQKSIYDWKNKGLIWV